MTSIVRDRYPASRLPDDLRSGLDEHGQVRITIEPAVQASGDRPLTRLLEEMQDCRVFSDDPVQRVRALRAEWEWREELHDRIRSGDED